MPADLSGYPKEFAELLNEFDRESKHLMDQLEKGAIDQAVWLARMKELVLTHSAAARLLGQGYGPLSDASRLQTELWFENTQLQYLKDFSTLMGAADQFNPAWQSRAHMYGAATYTQYWEGVTGGLALPAQPAQGTQCLSNCRCSWDIQWLDKSNGDADCYWKLGEAEHCQTCLTRAEMWNPIRIRKGGIVGGDTSLPVTSEPPGTPPAGQSGWRDILNPDERVSVKSQAAYHDGLNYLSRIYTGGTSAETGMYRAMRGYTHREYTPMNGYLRGYEQEDEATTKAIDKLRNLFNKIPPTTGKTTVVRGGNNPSGLEVGSIIHDKGFMSTSSVGAVVKAFVREGEALFVINIPAGSKVVPADGFSAHTGEEEIIINAGSNLRVDKIGVDTSFAGTVPVYYCTLME